MDTNSIKTRLTALGWQLKEIPIRRNHPDVSERVVVNYKLVAFKGEKSVEVGGENLDEAMNNLGKTLGVIANE